ncbi:MAG TPA: polymer-forming cytoskeletal protein [Candidatus Acidoferrales bacterium]
MAFKFFSSSAPDPSRPKDSDDWIGFLDRGVLLEGTLNLSGTFRIDGNVKGTIRCEQTLVLGEKAEVEGEIEADQVSVSGRFHGTVRAKTRVEILAKGVVNGELHTPSLVIEPGGVLEGRCHMLAEAESEKTVTIALRRAESHG